MDDKDGPPSAKALDDGYNQTYLVMNDSECKGSEGHEVFFRCGNWCYKGLIQFNDIKIGTAELPILIPTLQRQQGSLRYFCNAKSVPMDSDYSAPLTFLEDAVEFVASEIISDSVDKELRKMSNVFPWIDDDSASTYFELALANVPEYMRKVSIIANKTYTRGLIIISIYFERTIYFVIQGGEGDQPLLDVRFPDVSRHGQGLHISSYNNSSNPWKKLTLWHILESEATHVPREIPKIRTLNVSSKNYEQTYCILKSSWDSYSPTLSVHHDVLFRFGSWCYAGRVQLTPSLNLADIPYVIPALRMQQSRLDFLCDVNLVPTTSPFASGLEYMLKVQPMIEDHIVRSEDSLKSLIERLTNMGLGESVSKWLEGDPSNSFFEFKVEPNEELAERFKNIELIVSKCYHPSGIITMTIVFQHNIYVSVLETNGENPLLDSRFPDVSGKGRGYQLHACSNGQPDWPTLRKVSIWQTVSALEQEFRDKAAEFAQTKNRIEMKMLNQSDAREEDEESLEEESKGVDSRNRADSDDEFASTAAESKTGGSPSTKADTKNTVMATPIKTREDTASRPGGSDEKRSYAASAAGSANASAALSPSSSGPSSSATASSSAAVVSSPSGGLEPLRRPQQALPHHIPKMDALSKRMDDIRKTMGEEGMKAPWDSKGKPLGAIGGGGGGGAK